MLIKPLRVFYQFFPERVEVGVGGIEHFHFIGGIIVGAVVVTERNLTGIVGYAVKAAAGMFGGDVEIEFLWHDGKGRQLGR